MGKKTRMKWRRLDILESDQTSDPSPDQVYSHHSQPFLKSLESCEGGVDISQLTGAPISYNPLLPSHPEEYELQYLPEPVPQYNHGLYYYNTTNTPSQQQMFLPPLPPLPQYNLVQQESVQFVPYYYYYPVPDTATPLPPVSSTQTEISQPVSPHPKFISSSSCDSSIENKVRKYTVSLTLPGLPNQQVVRRRRKKKRSQEKDETDDSGYFNGPDSSTETSSDEDRGQSGELGVTLQLGDKKEEAGDDDVDQAETGAVNIEFGDVQEILDELSRETNQSETEQKADSELSKEMEEVKELKLNQEEKRDKQEQSSLITVPDPASKQKKKSTKKRTKITTSQNNENSNLEIPQKEKFERWTEVKSSRKSRQHPTHTVLRKTHTTSNDTLQQEVSVKKTKSSTSLRKDDSKKNETNRPLEDLKELFFQEKDVTIIESTQKEEKPPSRKDGRKQRKKNQLKKEGNIKKIEISSKPCIKEEEDVLDSNPLLLNPFCDFEEFLRPQQRRVGSSNKMTFLEPCYTPLLVSDFSPNRSYSDGLAQRHSDLRELSFLFGATEDKLIRMKAVRSSIVKSGHAKPVILLRPTPPFGSGNFFPSGKILRKQNQVVKKIEIPGPRVKYLPATRMGILGMKRVVVPPQCLANRFGKI